ncbi:hypothetical protein NQ317_006867 [Molorchus minor]|uniref:Uncharacterized protein n=1 Tax=Molorchus minor TaxID=1323400 RepID=A0ABQ9K1N7_9CUCU|nr:hypothetical protein NQ317_006867 [Molorchus minor]
MTQNPVTPQHFSPATTVPEITRQTVLMWGSNHIHASPVSNRSPHENAEYSIGSVPPSEGCEALKSLAEISDPEMCKWNGEENKQEGVVQTSDPDSPHQHHSSHHSHHNSRHFKISEIEIPYSFKIYLCITIKEFFLSLAINLLNTKIKVSVEHDFITSKWQAFYTAQLRHKRA